MERGATADRSRN